MTKRLILSIFFALLAHAVSAQPAPQPSPWSLNGNNIYPKSSSYCITYPSSVVGGCPTPGAANFQSLYIGGVAVTAVPGSGAANLVLATPNGSSGAATLRSLVGADLPKPSATTLGGIESIASLSNNWVSYIDTSGVPHQSQPAFSNLSGNYTLAQGPTIGANTVLGETASGTPIALAVGSCSGATNALTWTSGTGFGCNTITGAVTSVFGRTGTVVAATNDYSFSQLAGNYTLAQGPTIGANTILGETASGTPLALAIGSCSGATNALTWTSGTGFGCNTLSGSGTVNSGTANDLAYYASNGTAVSQLATVASSVLTSNGSGALTWGTALPAGITATTQSLGTNNTTLATSAALYTNGETRCGADQNPSGVQYVTLSGLSSAKKIEITFDAIPATNGVSLYAQFSQSGSFIGTSSYSYGYVAGGTVGSASAGGASGQNQWPVSPFTSYNTATNVTAAGASVKITIPNPQTTASVRAIASLATYGTDGNFYTGKSSVLFNNGSGAIDGIRLYFSSGNIASGHFTSTCTY